MVQQNRLRAEEPISVCILGESQHDVDYLREWIGSQPGFSVMYFTDDYKKAEAILKTLTPDVLLINYHFAGGSGYDMARMLHRQNKNLHIIAYSYHYYVRQLFAMLDAGVLAFLTNLNHASQWLEALRQASQGNIYYTELLTQRQRDDHEAACANNECWWREPIDDETIELAMYKHDGLKTKEIAAIKKVPPEQIENRFKAKYRQHHCGNSHDFVRMVIRERKMEG